MKVIIYISSISLSIISLFYFFGMKEDAFIFKIASKIIGHPPQSGDGAFHYPLGWLLLLLMGLVIGLILGFLITKLIK